MLKDFCSIWIMGRKFSTFIRQRIGVVMVFTFTANIILFSAILAYTGSSAGDEGIEGVKQKLTKTSNADQSTPKLRKGEHIHLSEGNGLERENEKGQFDIKGQMNHLHSNLSKKENSNHNMVQHNGNVLKQPKGRLPKKVLNTRKQSAIEHINAEANAKNAKLYHMNDEYPNGQVAEMVDKPEKQIVESERVIKPEEIPKILDIQRNTDVKAPQTFNAKYIEYFWKHSEMQNIGINKKVLIDNNNYGNKNEMKAVQTDSEIHIKQGKVDNENSFKEAERNVNRHLPNHIGNRQISDYKEIERKLDLKNSARLNPETSLQNLSYVTMFPAKGQLGNQMFQLASLLGIADYGNFIPFLPASVFDLNKTFDLPKGLIRDIDITYFETFSEEIYSQSKSINESKHLDTRRNWTLDGYFQSYKYFNKVSNRIKKYLKFHEYVWVQALHFLNQNVPARRVKVAIHIRRGDFISSYQARLGRVAATPAYVKRAMAFFESNYRNVTFVVASDDMRWCRENINGDNVIYSTTPYNKNGLDLAIISNCDHVIISVGTFGWWGGWLSGGKVIYYKNFPARGSDLDEMFIPENYYPSHWIGLE